VHQHLPAIYSRNPKTPGRSHKRRRTRAIHQVHHGTRPRKALKIEWEFIVTVEPQTGRVHNQVELAVIDIGMAFRNANTIPTDPARHCSGPLNRTIKNQHVLGLIINQADERRTRGASRTEQQHPVPGRGATQKVTLSSPEALDVGVVPTEFS
jgi:hypothetical protein